jgi:hypothetical protein
VVGHLEQFGKDITTDFRRAGSAGNPESITATGNFDVKAAFDLPQVFIKLTAEVGKAVVVGGLENDISRNLDSTQNLFLKPL